MFEHVPNSATQINSTQSQLLAELDFYRKPVGASVGARSSVGEAPATWARRLRLQVQAVGGGERKKSSRPWVGGKEPKPRCGWLVTWYGWGKRERLGGKKTQKQFNQIIVSTPWMNQTIPNLCLVKEDILNLVRHRSDLGFWWCHFSGLLSKQHKTTHTQAAQQRTSVCFNQPPLDGFRKACWPNQKTLQRILTKSMLSSLHLGVPFGGWKLLKSSD